MNEQILDFTDKTFQVGLFAVPNKPEEALVAVRIIQPNGKSIILHFLQDQADTLGSELQQAVSAAKNNDFSELYDDSGVHSSEHGFPSGQKEDETKSVKDAAREICEYFLKDPQLSLKGVILKGNVQYHSFFIDEESCQEYLEEFSRNAKNGDLGIIPAGEEFVL